MVLWVSGRSGQSSSVRSGRRWSYTVDGSEIWRSPPGMYKTTNPSPINDGIFTIQLVISSIIQLVISSINSRIAAWLCQVTADKPFRFAAAAFIAWRSRRWGKAMATYYPWGCEMVNGILYYWSFTYLEPKWPLFLKVNPPKQGPFQSKQGSFGFQVDIWSICILTWHLHDNAPNYSVLPQYCYLLFMFIS